MTSFDLYDKMDAAEGARPGYVGKGWRLFWLALGQVLLTIFTFGIGRFWMITRLRRYYWSSILIDNEPLEYTGRALEKLIGFFIAVVILAAYLAMVNLLLTFAGIAVFRDQNLAIALSAVAVAPLGFWAQYRARRYILARTRWRGIRFGVAPGAVGYMLRAMGWWLAVIVSFGLMFPLMQLDLAHYKAERTWFGDLRFQQGGHWWGLMKSWLFLWLPVAGAVIWAAGNWTEIAAAMPEAEFGEDADLDKAGPAAQTFIAVMIGVFAWTFFNYIRHSVFAFRYINSHRTLGGETGFTVTLRSWTVIWIYVVGSIAISLLVGVVVTLVMLFGFGLAMAGGMSMEPDINVLRGGLPQDAAAFGLFALIMFLYLFSILFTLALGHVFITQPMLRAACRSTRIHNLEAASRARQRDHDAQTEAGGFADALGADIGGGF